MCTVVHMTTVGIQYEIKPHTGRTHATMTTLPSNIADDLTDILNEIGSLTANRSGGFTVAHDEGHEHDHGDEQDTIITLRIGDTTEQWTYQLPADTDDSGETYWQAFDAADDMITTWLTAHGITDIYPTESRGTGLSIESRDTGWSIDIPRGTWKPTALDRVRLATAEKINADVEAAAKLRAWRRALADADRDRATNPNLKVEDIYMAARVSREGYYKALQAPRGETR